MPSSGEWVAIYNAWNSWNRKSTSESSVGRNFAKDLKLPPNGTHSSHDDPNAIAEYNKLYWFYRGSYGYYWSSTPVNNYYAYLVRFPR